VLGPAGRVLEFVDERLEQKDDQEMGQEIRLGGAFVGAWRAFQADQAFQALEGEFDPPSQAIEGKNVGGREVLGSERGHQDHPLRGGEGSFGDLMAPLSRLSARRRSRGFGGLSGFFDGDQPQSEGLAVFAPDKDRPIDQPAIRRLAEFSEKIDGLALAVEPARIPPPGAHQDVGALIEHAGDALGLQISAVGDADLALDDGNPIKRLAAMLIGTDLSRGRAPMIGFGALTQVITPAFSR